jgi:uncharacterized membrane protein AbrB (regulator of aidB expression)
VPILPARWAAVIAVTILAALACDLAGLPLATTPGGLYAVLATAVGSGGNTTFVLAVQVLRLFVMRLAAPVLARALVRERTPAG